MIIDPTALIKATASASPMPTVIPSPEIIYQDAGDVGNRTLWYCTPKLPRTLRLLLMLSGLSA
jgi:hypothetical protein